LNMTAAVSPLSSSESFAQMFVGLSDTPVLGFLAGTGVAFLIQSSSATIGILQALSTTGALTFSSVYAIIIGVNIGDCVTTAIVCSIGSKADAKRTGIVHILFNICGSVLVIAGIMILRGTGVLDGLWDRTMTSGLIANVHTVFRLFSAIVLLPVCAQFEKLSRIIVKDEEKLGTSVEKELEMLDEKLFDSPALALNSALSAISIMAKLATEGVLSAMDVLQNYDKHKIDVINENEDSIDLLADRVDNYLIKLSPHALMGYGNELLNYYIQCFSEFERIGDYAVNLTENAQEMKDKGIELTGPALQELAVMRNALEEILGYAYKSFSALDMRAARHIEPVEEVVDDLVATLRSNHIRRMREGKCTTITGLIYLDILVNIERISDQCSNLGVYTLSQSDSTIMSNHHEYIHQLHQGLNEDYNRKYSDSREKYFGELAMIEE
ncbi:MAG: Na/Pi cotransporter family protein, partial [Oscillospiraceae bacterium]|nr:Na/Pi cotransporter family protein [Oscillospiraceae bacterium]